LIEEFNYSSQQEIDYALKGLDVTKRENLSVWKEFADCRGLPLSIFYPNAGSGKSLDLAIARAKAICNDCPVERECGEYAIINENFGIWGGLSEEERHDIRRRQRLGRVSLG